MLQPDAEHPKKRPTSLSKIVRTAIERRSTFSFALCPDVRHVMPSQLAWKDWKKSVIRDDQQIEGLMIGLQAGLSPAGLFYNTALAISVTAVQKG